MPEPGVATPSRVEGDCARCWSGLAPDAPPSSAAWLHPIVRASAAPRRPKPNNRVMNCKLSIIRRRCSGHTAYGSWASWLSFTFPSRAMYELEFGKLWDAQRPNHPAILTDDLRREIHQTIFNQRPLKVQKNLVGKCELEPTRKRAPKGLWYSQQFRLLQDVSHLDVLDTKTGEIMKLNPGERKELIAELQKKQTMT